MKILSVLLLLVLASSCHRAHEACDCETPASTSAQRYPLRGVVKAVNTAGTTLTVKHEPIPGLMPAMTMVFVVTAEDCAKVKAGDTLTAELLRRGEEWALEKIQVVPPSPEAAPTPSAH